ncbi:M20/M25/M40 family metallo-hydrolase [Serratia marcescens]|uniref:M20/M25/M40 family metallo-hydrolase n=1 Tax=Serratia marcescens TaxID=615 RepID=UPI00124A6589|nr:M20/M25/M40 family metallo-hydrolase [Serratia marcescens]KAB1579175.1 M20 family metallopeptidase [Serratia marcescens]
MKTAPWLLAAALGCSPLAFAAGALTPDEQALTRYITEHKAEQLQLLETLVNINSGTANAQGVRRTGERLRPEFELMGFHTRWAELPPAMKHTGSLIAIHDGKGAGLLLIGHLDTVFPQDSPFQTFALSPDGKTATGPGVIDDKGGIVTLLYALKALDHTGKLKDARITVVLTGDEELAAKPTSLSRLALREVAQTSDIALGFEFALSPDRLVTARRGLSEWFLSSIGKPMHSSVIFSSDAGDGAIYETARVLNAFHDALSDTPGLTLSPGLLLGGQTVNEDIQQGTGRASGLKTIIAAKTRVHGDLRYLSEPQKNAAVQKMRTATTHPLPHTSSQLAISDIMPVMPETEASRQLLTQFSDISVALGEGPLQAIPAAERGGADASYIAQYVPAVIDGLGAWGSGAHSPQETLVVSSLPVVTSRTAIFIRRHTGQKSTSE